MSKMFTISVSSVLYPPLLRCSASLYVTLHTGTIITLYHGKGVLGHAVFYAMRLRHNVAPKPQERRLDVTPVKEDRQLLYS